MSCLKRCLSGLGTVFQTLKPVQVTQTRNRYVNWQMRKDVRKRTVATELYPLRLRLVALKRSSKVLPDEIKQMAQKDIEALPRDSCPAHSVNRCVITSRPRGIVQSHRLSRIMWRILADYNKMSGIIRAKW